MGNTPPSSSSAAGSIGAVAKKKKATRAAAEKRSGGGGGGVTSYHEKITLTDHSAAAPAGNSSGAATAKPKQLEDSYEKVRHLADGSSCSIWLVRLRLRRRRRKGDKASADDDEEEEEEEEAASPPAGSDEDDEGGPLYVLKSIKKSAVDGAFLKEMQNEVSILRRLDHPNVVRVYDLFDSEREMHLVMEYCSGGHLGSTAAAAKAPYADERRAAMVLTKLLSAVAFMHRNGVVHRDIKPENVMFENDSDGAEPKVIDFGLSKPIEGKGKSAEKYRMKCRVGTLRTMSPQVLKGDYTAKADMWSVGVVAYFLLSGKYPFDGESNKDIIQAIMKGDYSLDGPEWDGISQPAKDFVASLLEYDPQRRISASAALRSKWLQHQYPLKDRRPEDDIMDDIKKALLGSQSSSKSKADAFRTFQRLVHVIVAHKSSNESLRELRAAFDALDTNNEGVINYWEFRKALQPYGYPDEDLKQIFEAVDVDGTGGINYTEFLAVALEAQGNVPDGLVREAFDRIDRDGDGVISKVEICELLGPKCSASTCECTVNEVLDHLDEDSSGTITYDEFLTLFRGGKAPGPCCHHQQCKKLEEDNDAVEV